MDLAYAESALGDGVQRASVSLSFSALTVMVFLASFLLPPSGLPDRHLAPHWCTVIHFSNIIRTVASACQIAKIGISQL